MSVPDHDLPNLNTIATMNLDALKDLAVEIGAGAFAGMCEHHLEIHAPPSLQLQDGYSVTFQHPARHNDFKRFPCHKGDRFFLKGVRGTKSNVLIWQFEPGPNVKKNMARHAVGPGLSKAWETAEFTHKLIKNDRMTGREFMEDVVWAYVKYRTLDQVELFKGVSSGTW